MWLVCGLYVACIRLVYGLYTACIWLVHGCCTGQVCVDPPLPANGGRFDCPEPFIYGAKCSYRCDAGHELPPDGVRTVVCDLKGRAERGVDDADVAWDDTPTGCISASTQSRTTIQIIAPGKDDNIFARLALSIAICAMCEIEIKLAKTNLTSSPIWHNTKTSF